VGENLMFWARFLNGALGPGDARFAERGLEAVGLADLADLPAGYLSAGQRRRLSLARMLAVPRPIWLLDEPTSALDVASQDRLHRIMLAHLAEGGIIVAATHGPLGLEAPVELRLGRPSPPYPSAPAEADGRGAAGIGSATAGAGL
jgi:heme exporter protein A